jgi:hypothetical protein
MSLCYRERRQLRGVEAALFRSDLHLAGMLEMFGRLYSGQDMPASEHVPSGQGRSRRAVTRIALAFAVATLAFSILFSVLTLPSRSGAPASGHRPPSAGAPGPAGKPTASRTLPDRIASRHIHGPIARSPPSASTLIHPRAWRSPGSRCDLDGMSGHHPMRMSPGRARRGCGSEWCCQGFAGGGSGWRALGPPSTGQARRCRIQLCRILRTSRRDEGLTGTRSPCRGEAAVLARQLRLIAYRRPRRSCGSIDGGSLGPRRSWHGRGGACGANPLAGFGSEASKDQHDVLDAEHTTKGMSPQ